jgi:hypothetical protein
VVVYGNGEDSLGTILPHHVLIKVVFDFGRFLQLRRYFFLSLFPILRNDVVAEVDTFIANVDGGTGDELTHFVTAFPAKRASQVPINLFLLSHAASCTPKVN